MQIIISAIGQLIQLDRNENWKTYNLKCNVKNKNDDLL